MTLTTETLTIETAHGEDPNLVDGLVDILKACVDAGASVSFMAGMTREEAAAFWRAALADNARGSKLIFIARLAGEPVGTVTLAFAPQPNQPHRADIAKLLVHPRARRLGIARALMQAMEAAARAAGRTLLVLDTVPEGDAYRLYHRLGYVEVGRIPGYALMPDGTPSDTAVFYKWLETP